MSSTNKKRARIVDFLKKKKDIHTVEYKLPRGDKQSRAFAITGFTNASQVKIFHGSWNEQFSERNLLDKDEKSDLLWYFGVYLMSRPYLEGMVNLYGLDDFYVEVFYNQELNCVEDIRSFQSVECLEQYFDSILLNLE